ncbi:MAG TPA: asparagine synthase (glutamine-hydrolyzing) [Terriglobales bacterium]
MCGIVGILARGVPVPPEILEAATRSLAHRGPDDSGTLILRAATSEPIEIGLGNRRLAILDLSARGHQPMQDATTGNCIVFNGEIYNYRHLRTILEKEGASFLSDCDTEVLLKAYHRWGERCLDHLRGMFAFALWDAGRQRLFVARDPMGIKPLYYYWSERYFLFASEVRSMLGTGLISRRLDHAGLFNYLNFGSACDPNTLIEGISSLLPGHYLTWEKGAIETRCYWDPIPNRTQDVLEDSEASRNSKVAMIRDLLLESVNLHLVSDVPVGVFLSGGIDSSSLVALLSEIGVRPKTFSLVFREAKYSEAEYSREVASQFRTEHREICITAEDALKEIPGALAAMDQPTIDGVNTYIVSRHTHEAGLKVALSGLGGDEMFAGYSSFRTVPGMERFARPWMHLPKMLRSSAALAYSLTGDSDQTHKLAALVRDPRQVIHPLFLSRMLFTPEQVKSLLPTMDDAAMERASRTNIEMLERSRQLDPINRVAYLEARGYMVNTLLRDSDVMSMAHGLELRVPFVDEHLAGRLMRIPGKWKMNGKTPKPLLVGALENKLPDSVVYRRKQGFTLPFEHWLRNELRRPMEGSLLAKGKSSLSSVLELAAVHEVWRNFLEGKTSWSRPWSLHVLSQWCDLHL